MIENPIVVKGFVLHFLFIYLFIYLKIRTMYRGENNRTRSPLLGSPSYLFEYEMFWLIIQSELLFQSHK